MSGEPTAHGVYDFFLGGSSHLRADREAAQRIAARWPSVPVLVRAADDFHIRAGVWCAERGVTRFIRFGAATYVPHRSFSAAVRKVNPDARVTYLIPDEDPYALSAGLAADMPGVDILHMSGEDLEAVLKAEPVAEMLAAGPVCVIFGLGAYFHPPRRAAQAIGEYVSALPRGSYVAISAMVTADPAEAREFRGMFPRKIWPWTAEDVARTVSGLEVVPPGVMPVHEWPAHTRWAGPPLEGPVPVHIVSAVARKS